MKAPIRVAVTGAAGNIGYALVFRIAAGDAFGKDQPVILHMVEIPPVMKALEGVAMELNDGAFPLLEDMVLADNPTDGFDGVSYAMLVGSMPRRKGMLRIDLVQKNGPIFVGQGKALNKVAASDIRVVVVGNPANSNALIAMNNAPDIPRARFTAMTRLDHNRALSQLATKSGALVRDIRKMTIWGNHSPTMVPDISHTTIGGQAATDILDQEWVRNTFMPTVAKRGGAVLAARGKSSAASAGSAALDHVRNWHLGTDGDDWVSMSVPSELGDYGIADNLIFSYPVRVKNGEYEVVNDLAPNEFYAAKIKATEADLLSERASVEDLL